MLPVYDLDRIREFIPFNICMLGQRRSGKSVATWKLAEHLAPNFDLVISFIGTRNCNKELCDLISTRYDPRLNFVEFNPHVLEKLLEQQEKLIQLGTPREVLGCPTLRLLLNVFRVKTIFFLSNLVYLLQFYLLSEY